jgi:hypothetical protein
MSPDDADAAPPPGQVKNARVHRGSRRGARCLVCDAPAKAIVELDSGEWQSRCPEHNPTMLPAADLRALVAAARIGAVAARVAQAWSTSDEDRRAFEDAIAAAEWRLREGGR